MSFLFNLDIVQYEELVWTKNESYFYQLEMNTKEIIMEVRLHFVWRTLINFK